MWINSQGLVYEGDCIVGDRQATDNEIAAWNVNLSRSQLKLQAKTALDKSDLVAIRCCKAGIVFPAEWQAWTLQCRNIVNGTDATSTVLPTEPVYPAGT